MSELPEVHRPCRACENRYTGDSEVIRQLVAVSICLSNAAKIIDELVEELARGQNERSDS